MLYGLSPSALSAAPPIKPAHQRCKDEKPQLLNGPAAFNHRSGDGAGRVQRRIGHWYGHDMHCPERQSDDNRRHDASPVFTRYTCDNEYEHRSLHDLHSARGQQVKLAARMIAVAIGRKTVLVIHPYQRF